MADEEQNQPDSDVVKDHATVSDDTEKHTIHIGNVTGPVHTNQGDIVITFFGIAASISSITQVILMIADMRSRKAKKKPELPLPPNTILLYRTDWDGLKEIKVQMSDGTQVQIDSWLHDPKKIKEFLEIYTSQSASPKPEKVMFVFKNGSRIPLTISNDPGSEEELDALIKHLQL
jgi:hypothetical protein